jgi:hypothetical protein
VWRAVPAFYSRVRQSLADREEGVRYRRVTRREGKVTMNNQQPASAAKSQTEDGVSLEDYDSMSAEEIVRKLPKLSPKQVEKLCRYEKAHKKRRSLLRYFEGRIGSAAATATSGREDPPPGEERPEKRRETEIGTVARENPAPGEERPERRVP